MMGEAFFYFGYVVYADRTFMIPFYREQCIDVSSSNIISIIYAAASSTSKDRNSVGLS